MIEIIKRKIKNKKHSQILCLKIESILIWGRYIDELIGGVGVLGIVKWEIQELSTQGIGEHIQGEKVPGLLCVSKRRQNSEAPRQSVMQK